MSIANAAWCVACGSAPETAISAERNGIMMHWGSCLAHIHDVADRALRDLARIDTEGRLDIHRKPGGYLDVELDTRARRDAKIIDAIEAGGDGP